MVCNYYSSVLLFVAIDDACVYTLKSLPKIEIALKAPFQQFHCSTITVWQSFGAFACVEAKKRLSRPISLTILTLHILTIYQ